MDLPGIGSFTLDAAAVIPQESDRVGQVPASGISFKNANIAAPDEALILFIKEHTGKMKSLASADLDFFLTTGRQLLNIGKPFFLEGIGTLLKNKEGQLDFAPGEYTVARLEEPHSVTSEKKSTSFEDGPRQHHTGNTNIRQTLLLIGLVGGLVIIGWGGYYLYKRNNYVEPTQENQARVIPEPAPRADSTGTAGTSGANSQKVDTAAKQATGATTPATGSNASTNPTAGTTASTNPAAGATATPAAQAPVVSAGTIPIPAEGQSLYRFVILQTPNKSHALRRYNQLLGYQLNIKMDQKDSSFFKLYFPIAAAIRDTTHIKDSLADVYAAHVVIEH